MINIQEKLMFIEAYGLIALSIIDIESYFSLFLFFLYFNFNKYL